MINYPEYFAHEKLSYWQPIRRVLGPEDFVSKSSKYYVIFCHYYVKVRRLYGLLPSRKNGEDTFLHPLNVVYFLRKGQFLGHELDEITLLVGLLHDYLEEIIDINKEKHQLEDLDEESLKFRAKLIVDFEEELEQYCQAQGYPRDLVKQIMEPLLLVTKGNEDSYYTFTSRMFNCKNKVAQERAIIVKLADRTHNILSIECFNKRERIYECFKNLFILNNVKMYLLKRYGTQMWNGQINNPVELFFNKCIKATHDAFFHICYNSVQPKYHVSSMLQMAFKKFSLLLDGLEGVPEVSKGNHHLTSLYTGIIRKYDYLLHKEITHFKKAVALEMDYCGNFFVKYKFTDEQLHQIIDYKDAYYLKEYLARLLYKPEYYMSGFNSAELSNKSRIKQK